MSAFLIANVDVRDAGGYEQYRNRTQAIVESHGGRFLVRGGDVEVLEGNPAIRRLVILEFPNRDTARTFYDSADYQAVLPFRTANAATDMFIVEGWKG